MPGATRVATGNELFDTLCYLGSVTYPTLAASASSLTTVSMPGLQLGDCISWNLVQNSAGTVPPLHLQIDNIYVTANTLNILWGTDGTGISTGSVGLLIEVIRGENTVDGGLTALPSAIF